MVSCGVVSFKLTNEYNIIGNNIMNTNQAEQMDWREIYFNYNIHYLYIVLTEIGLKYNILALKWHLVGGIAWIPERKK